MFVKFLVYVQSNKNNNNNNNKLIGQFCQDERLV